MVFEDRPARLAANGATAGAEGSRGKVRAARLPRPGRLTLVSPFQRCDIQLLHLQQRLHDP